MFEMIKHLTVEMGGLKSEMSGFRSEMNEFKTEMNEFKSEVYHRFDQVDVRFDTVDLKLDNLTTESRSYFKRLEDKTDTHEFVLQKLSYKEIIHDGQIAEVKEKLK